MRQFLLSGQVLRDTAVGSQRPAQARARNRGVALTRNVQRVRRMAHPESNGRLERLHRTHREEGLIGEALTAYAQGVAALTRWQDYYNHRRPHSALRYLWPVDYYRGDPETRLAERRQKLQLALVARQTYWKAQEDQTEAAGG